MDKKEYYYVILSAADGEILVSKHDREELIQFLNMRMDEATTFVDSIDCCDSPNEWAIDSEGEYEDGSAMLIIKGKIVVPDITKKVDYKCDIE